MIKQKTIKKDVSLSSKAIHSGVLCNLTLSPAPADAGITFLRTDLDENNQIKLTPSNISRGERRTVLSNGHASLNTIEHLLSALHALHITNLIIKVDHEELPGGDGSALKFLEMINDAGIEELDAEIEPIVITRPLIVDSPDGMLSVLPSKKFEIDYTLDYSHCGVPLQREFMEITPESFVNEIARCRTFCMKQEWDVRLDHGLGQGATHENTVVMDGSNPVETALRCEHELARHKMLDLIGDLYILGRPVIGKFVALKSGHATNVAMVKDIQRNFAFNPLMIEDIKEMLPHRFPFLLIDRITELDPGKSAKGYKNVSANEEFFQGHFPSRPVMPGVLQIEAMAQLAGTMLLSDDEKRMIPMFTAIDKAKFRRTVVPGDQLQMEAKVIKFRRNMGEMIGRAYVDGQLASEATFKFIIVEET